MTIDSNVVRKFIVLARDNALDNGTQDYIKGYMAALDVMEQIVLDNSESIETESQKLIKECLSF